MLVHRYGQYSTRGRVILWVARRLSLALTIVVLAPSLTRAVLTCNVQQVAGRVPPEVARQICRDEIQHLRDISQIAAELIAELEVDSKRHELTINADQINITIPTDGAGAY